MQTYLLKRLFMTILVLLVVTVFLSLLVHIVPGDPAKTLLGPRANPEEIQRLTEEFGLDKPLPVQYFNYMRGLLRGDLGRSMMNGHKVSKDLIRFFPATLELVLVSMALATGPLSVTDMRA